MRDNQISFHNKFINGNRFYEVHIGGKPIGVVTVEVYLDYQERIISGNDVVEEVKSYEKIRSFGLSSR